MIVEVEAVGNVFELVEDSINIDVTEELSNIVELDQDELIVTIFDGEQDYSVEIVEESLSVEVVEELISIIEVGCDPSGGSFGSPYFIIDFQFDSISPLILVNMLPGDYILDTELDITEAFDDPNAKLSIGTALDNELLISEDENKPSELGSYGSFENFPFALAESVRLFINPGTSSSGSGRVVLLKV